MNNARFIEYFYSNFEDGEIKSYTSPIDGWYVQAAPGECEIVPHPLGDGYAAKLQINYNTDYETHLAAYNGKPRSNISHSYAPFRFRYGNTYVVSFDLYLPLDFQIDTNANNQVAVCGFHSADSGEGTQCNIPGQSSCRLDIFGDTLYYGHGYVDESLVSHYLKFPICDLSELIGVKTNFKISFKSRQNKKGRVRIWKNGQQIINFKGQTCRTGVNELNYLKLGPYKYSWKLVATSTTNHTLYYSNIHVKKYT